MFFRRRSNVIPIAGVRNPQPARPRAASPRNRTVLRWPRVSPIWLALPFAIGAVVHFWPGVAPLPAPSTSPAPSAQDRESASFAHCSGGVRRTCIVDGDTFWYEGEKIRIADINTPETSESDCAQEAELGAKATARMTQLLNEGRFSLEPWTDGRDTDRYGRKLRVVMRGGQSLGEVLVSEGLAERWTGHRRNWC